MGAVLVMEKRPHIVIVGSINMDLVIRTAHLPVPGETVLGGDYQTFPGGKGANQAVAAAKLAASTTMLGAVGEDTFAEVLVENLRSAGVNTDAVIHKKDSTSGIALIGIDDASGENFIIVSGGANRKFSPQDVLNAEDVIKSADILICQLEIPMESVTAALRLAKKHHVKTVLNAAPMTTLTDKLLQLVDYLIVNETEAAQLSGLDIEELEHIEQASAILLGKGIGCIVLTMGAKGAHIVDQEHRVYVPAYPVKAIDTVGAGDAFVGAFAAAIARDESLTEALKFGNAVGALATTKLGAQSGSPTAEEVQRFLQKFSNKEYV